MNPLPALAMAIMALNDHWAKYAFPGLLTGKLSDFAGVFYFPLFLCALYCLVKNLLLTRQNSHLPRANLETQSQKQTPSPGSPRIASIHPRLMIFSCLATGALMAAIKLSPTVSSVIESSFSSWFFRIQIVPDPSDLTALVMLPASYWYSKHFFKR